ncbi:hypothetical protein KAFR_0D04990 [Kazachstania africana CBS 2517]|uniref:SET domain-containing protein n=1 Tax=Kazachstania africana (strain ATCC 22294 / BCRC 22015 / CBS 2517 / CECT 1963 / NBRC 1671 / NRRL Y-8276) TaxID=1071382 RepID=H2AUU6_KAZAF|nr:hypothetical protein KAFR_0D04990 [Kazachstania africana CBS 2517]CCF58146.1 hypothetical protein KAFR_0D04990 [Kazachstania africana CBS 2517]
MEKPFNWVLKNSKIFLNDNVVTGKSNLGGSGLFIRGDTTIDADTILLRIPPQCAINIHTILDFLEDTSRYTSAESIVRTIAIFKRTIRKFQADTILIQFVSETVLLIFYFCTLDILCNEKHEIPKLLKVYVREVLLVTETNDTVGKPDLFKMYYSQYSTVHVQELLVAHLTNLLVGQFGREAVNTERIRHIYSSVTSRTLEIPCEIERSCEDFTINTTLVPILDFLNHSMEPNCVFDVDRANNEIIVRSLSSISHKNDTELTIVYDNVFELTKFFFTYGFIPKPFNNRTFFNLSIDRTFDQEKTLFYKWFDINFTVQLAYNEQENCWFINDMTDTFKELLLPFMRHPKNVVSSRWEYDEYAFDTLTYFHASNNGLEPHNLNELRRYYQIVVRMQENGANDYITLEQVAWSLSSIEKYGRNIKRKVTKEEALDHLNDMTAEYHNHTLMCFLDWFSEYIIFRINELERAIEDTELICCELTILRDLSSKVQTEGNIFMSAIKMRRKVAFPGLPPPLLPAELESPDYLADHEVGYDRTDTELWSIIKEHARKYNDLLEDRASYSH